MRPSSPLSGAIVFDRTHDIATESKAVDVGSVASLHSPSPVADWLAFLAELLVAEFLRDGAGGGKSP
jgi:hypothetical protein